MDAGPIDGPAPPLDAGVDSRRDVCPAERSLASLKSFSRIAWEQCRKPLSETAATAQVRWEIYSTWTLLLCLQHAEAEAERCMKTWKPDAWETEERALRHIFLRHRSVRILGAVLRWLRWAHHRSRGDGSADDEESIGEATYERTRRTMQRQQALPAPLQRDTALHPDGPLQSRASFVDADLEEERWLLRRIWVCLRRGNIQGALDLCSEKGQSWRAALLQGMMPFGDGFSEPVGYDVIGDYGDEDVLAKLKEEHTDWTEVGAVQEVASSCGNPWRRVWKEQCWDIAQRNVQTSSAMDDCELAIYGFCGGHSEAIMPMCTATWADRCFGELHCLKEWLIEYLLDAERAGSGSCLGEGTRGAVGLDGHLLGECADDDQTSDVDDTTCKEGRLCASKLHGRLHGVAIDQLEYVVQREIGLIFNRIRVVAASDNASFRDMALESLAPFARLQVTLIEAAWVPERGEEAVQMLRDWIAHGFEPTGSDTCPFLVKQFAGYFAIWHRDFATAAAMSAVQNPRDASTHVTEDGTMVQISAPGPHDVDDIVRSLVQELVAVAAGSWVAQCLDGQALELIAEHVSALSTENRLETYARLLLTLGAQDRSPSLSSTAQPPSGDCKQVSVLPPAKELQQARARVLRRALWVFWGRYPQEAFGLVTVLVRTTLRSGDQGSGAGVRSLETLTEGLFPLNMLIAVECLAEFWVVTQDRADDMSTIAGAVHGFELVLGEPYNGPLRTIDDFLRAALEEVTLPLLADALFCLSASHTASDRSIELALAALASLKESLLWGVASSCSSRCVETLRDLCWYLDLCQRHRSLLVAVANSRRCALLASETSSPALPAADALLDWAGLRLAQDRPLLEPVAGTRTLLSDMEWRRLQQSIASSALSLLLEAFEAVNDFEGALYELSVVVAQSPWMTSLSGQTSVRAFLQRLARLPALTVPELHAAAEENAFNLAS